MAFQTDAEPLLERLRNQDPPAVAALYRDMQKYLGPIAKQYALSQADLEDVLHDALILFLEKIRKPGFQLRSKVQVFVYGIALYLVLNQQRKNKRRQATSLQEEILQNENLVLDAADESKIVQWMDARNCQELVQAELDRLSAEEILILKLYYFEQMEIQHIATKLGISRNHAYQKKFRCINKFRERVQSDSVFADCLRMARIELDTDEE